MATYKKPTKDDVELFIHLLELNSSPQMEAAMQAIDGLDAKTYGEFRAKHPNGSPGDQAFNRVMSSFELAGALVSHGLINENLYFDVSGIGFVWDRLGPIVEGMRKEMSPALWENAAWLAERQKEWSKSVWKPGLAWKNTE